MNIYQYTAKDKSGNTIVGVLEAGAELEVADALHKKELIVVKVELTKKKSASRAKSKKVKLDDLVIFSRQLATMIDAGIPLVHALGILSEQIEKKGVQGSDRVRAPGY
jgi:type IV pilus assembly protein PilC